MIFNDRKILFPPCWLPLLLLLLPCNFLANALLLQFLAFVAHCASRRERRASWLHIFCLQKKSQPPLSLVRMKCFPPILIENGQLSTIHFVAYVPLYSTVWKNCLISTMCIIDFHFGFKELCFWVTDEY